MKRVIILSPYKGDLGRNMTYLRRAMADSAHRMEAPFASHRLYPWFLNDNVPNQRLKGFELEEAWLQVAEMVASYDDYGISKGMGLTLDKAHVLNLTVEHRMIGI